MSQDFPEITESDYIDTGIVDIQRRDLTALTYSWGTTAPESPKNGQMWINSTNGEWRFWNGTEWVLIVNPQSPPISQVYLQNNYQPKNSNLTTYAEVEVTGQGFICGNKFVPVSDYFADKFSDSTNATEARDTLELGGLATKNKLYTANFEDGVITKDMVSDAVVVDHPFKTGDLLVSLVNRVKTGFVHLSTTSGTVITIGGTGAGSDYRGNNYKDLYKFVWENCGTGVYTSSGSSSSKGSSWESDWSSNKRLALPYFDSPTSHIPSSSSVINKSSSGTFSVTVSEGTYRLIVAGAGGGCGARDTKSDHKGPGGAGGCGGYFDGYINLSAGTYTYTVGKGGDGCDNYSIGDNGGWDHCGADGTASSFGSYVTANGGTGGKGYLTKGCYDNNYYGYSRNGSIGGQGGTCVVHDSSVFRTGYVTGTGATATGYEGGSDNKDHARNIAGEGYLGYGQGNGYNNGWSATAAQKTGADGTVILTYVSPIRYNTTDTTKITELNNLFNSLNFYMKY